MAMPNAAGQGPQSQAEGAPRVKGVTGVLRESLQKLSRAIGEAGAEAREGQLICPTDDNGLTVQAVMGTGSGVTAHVPHGPELHRLVADAADQDQRLIAHIFDFYPARNESEQEHLREAKEAITLFTLRMCNDARQHTIHASQEVIANINSYISSIESLINKMHDIDKQLTSSIEDISDDPLSTDLHHMHRIQVKMKFDRDLELVIEKRKRKNHIEKRKMNAEREKEQAELDIEQYPHSRSLRDKIEYLDKDLSRYERDMKRSDADIIEHFSSCMQTNTRYAPSESISAG